MKMSIRFFLITSCISTSIFCTSTTQYSQPSQDSNNQSKLTIEQEEIMSKIRRGSFKRSDKKKRQNYTPEQDQKRNIFARLLHNIKK